jgi:hypothetical protein
MADDQLAVLREAHAAQSAQWPVEGAPMKAEQFRHIAHRADGSEWEITTWDITNDVGDPGEQFSVIDELTEERARFFALAHNLLPAVLDRLAAAEAQRDALLAELRRLEWSGRAEQGLSCCPTCGGFRPVMVGGVAYGRHFTGCTLAAALALAAPLAS